MAAEEWGKASTAVQPASYAVDWRKPLDGMRKGDYKRKKAEIFVNAKGVTVLRRESKKTDKRIGFWDFYHIKSWDVSPSHFAFKVVAKTPLNFYFETRQARTIADKFKAYVNNIMADRNRTRKTDANKVKDVFGVDDADTSAMCVLKTRTKVVKLEVVFQANGMMMAPPKSSLSRKDRRAGGRAPAKAAPPGAFSMGGPPAGGSEVSTRTEEVTVEETDNMLSELLGFQTDEPEEPAAAAAAPAAVDGGLMDFLAPAPAPAAAPTPVAAMQAMNPFGGAPAAMLQPQYAAQPTMQPQYGAQAPNPFAMGGGMGMGGGGMPQMQMGGMMQGGMPMMQPQGGMMMGGMAQAAPPNPFAQQQQQAPMNPFGGPAAPAAAPAFNPFQ